MSGVALEQARRHPGSRCQGRRPGWHWHREHAHRDPSMWRMLHGRGTRRPARTWGHAARCAFGRSSCAGAAERGGARRPVGVSHWLPRLSAGRSDSRGPGLARQGAAACGRWHRAAPYRTDLYRTVPYRTVPRRARRGGPGRAAPCRQQRGEAARRMRWRRRHCR